MKYSLSPWEFHRPSPLGFLLGSGYISQNIPPLVTIYSYSIREKIDYLPSRSGPVTESARRLYAGSHHQKHIIKRRITSISASLSLFQNNWVVHKDNECVTSLSLSRLDPGDLGLKAIRLSS